MNLVSKRSIQRFLYGVYETMEEAQSVMGTIDSEILSNNPQIEKIENIKSYTENTMRSDIYGR